jgi:hypothetical protein
MITAMRQSLSRVQPHGGQAAAAESNIAKVSISGDVAGLIVTVVMLGVLLTLGATTWFLAASLPVGVAVALILRWTAREIVDTWAFRTQACQFPQNSVKAIGQMFSVPA